MDGFFKLQSLPSILSCYMAKSIITSSEPTFRLSPWQRILAVSAFPLAHGFVLFMGMFGVLMWTHGMDLNLPARWAFATERTLQVPAIVMNEMESGEVLEAGEIYLDIMAVYFSYTPRGSNQDRIGVCYTPNRGLYPEGQAVAAEYPEGHPEYARLIFSQSGPSRDVFLLIPILSVALLIIWVWMVIYQYRFISRFVGAPMQVAEILVDGLNMYPPEGAVLKYVDYEGNAYSYDVSASYTRDLPEGYWVVVDTANPKHPIFPGSKPWPFLVGAQGEIKILWHRLWRPLAVGVLLLGLHTYLGILYFWG